MTANNHSYSGNQFLPQLTQEQIDSIERAKKNAVEGKVYTHEEAENIIQKILNDSGNQNPDELKTDING